MLLLLEKHHFPEKNFFWPPLPEIWLPKITQKFGNHDNFLNFRRQYLMVPNISHVFVMVLVFYRWGIVMKKLEMIL